jgi:hypothetical protein
MLLNLKNLILFLTLFASFAALRETFFRFESSTHKFVFALVLLRGLCGFV